MFFCFSAIKKSTHRTSVPEVNPIHCVTLREHKVLDSNIGVCWVLCRLKSWTNVQNNKRVCVCRRKVLGIRCLASCRKLLSKLPILRVLIPVLDHELHQVDECDQVVVKADIQTMLLSVNPEVVHQNFLKVYAKPVLECSLRAVVSRPELLGKSGPRDIYKDCNFVLLLL